MYRFYIDMPNSSALKTGRDPESLEPGTLPCGQDGYYGESSQTQISGCLHILLVHFTNMKHFRSIPSWLLVGDLVKPPKVIGEIGRSRNLFQVAPEAAPKPARMDGGGTANSSSATRYQRPGLDNLRLEVLSF